MTIQEDREHFYKVISDYEDRKDPSWGMVMPFLNDDELYVLGFEAGKIWQMCDRRDFPDHMLVHAKNVDQLILIANHFNCLTYWDDTASEEWKEVTFIYKSKLLTKEFNGNQRYNGGGTIDS